jgi:hypothetical protein
MTDKANKQDRNNRRVFTVVTLGSFGMAAVMSFVHPELVVPWLGVTGTFGAFLAGMPSKIKELLKCYPGAR